MGQFYLDEYLKDKQRGIGGERYDFYTLCSLVRREFQMEWDMERSNLKDMLTIQKNAMIGHEKEINFLKEKIKSILKKYGEDNVKLPPWYENIQDGIYQENWGLCGISQWFGKEYKDSSSAKIIGDRIYFMEKGEMRLKPQKLSKDRREQLVRALLLLTPEERLDKDFHEVYMLDGTRITIFRGAMVKEDEDVIVFRRYIIPEYTFEEQARRGTIPGEAIPLFKEMIKLGYSVCMFGPTRSAKTTFLATWQSYEDKKLEGVCIETDPEIPIHKLIPEAPVIQLIADGEKLKTITKNLMRSDPDYIILAEARDGVALDTVVKIAAKGTRRMKMTFHGRNPEDFPYDGAAEIVKSHGGDIEINAGKLASAFDYIFHFTQLRDKSKKRLKGIYEISFSRENRKISLVQICKYSSKDDNWNWNYHIGKNKEDEGMEENEESFERFKQELQVLAGGEI